MNIQQFVKDNTGKFLDFDGQFGAQCVDLVQFWAKALGTTTFWGNAIDIARQSGTDYVWIVNAPNNHPNPGDIVVWGPDKLIGTGVYGHVDICTNADNNVLFTFDQNWPTGSPCKEVKHSNYEGVLGWLHPKVLDVLAVDPKDQIISDLRTQVSSLQTQATNRDKTISDLNSQLNLAQNQPPTVVEKIVEKPVEVIREVPVVKEVPMPQIDTNSNLFKTLRAVLYAGLSGVVVVLAAQFVVPGGIQLNEGLLAALATAFVNGVAVYLKNVKS